MVETVVTMPKMVPDGLAFDTGAIYISHVIAPMQFINIQIISFRKTSNRGMGKGVRDAGEKRRAQSFALCLMRASERVC